ncbi:MAG: GspE/PulE family protein, partial [Phycisphaeraceae bacterium]
MLRRGKQQASRLDARQAVQRTVEEAVSLGASDIHVEPTGTGYELRYRVDGLLETRQVLDVTMGRAYVSRLMVAGKLLTYRLDIPQEGRCTFTVDAQRPPLDLRVSVMPTAHGLRAVVRLPAELHQPRALDELHLPAHLRAGLQHFIDADSGMLLLTGPAGSGKTTTIYALLEAILAQSTGLSIVSLEDPIERDVAGVTQIEVTPFGELTYERALRSILRQDPQVLALGEIRDRATASIAVQAALSGHRLVSTLHAGTPGAAIVRLLEMGVEPYQAVSALTGVVSLRLVRRLDAEDGYRG